MTDTTKISRVTRWSAEKVHIVMGDGANQIGSSETGQQMAVESVLITYETLPNGAWSCVGATVEGHLIHDDPEHGPLVTKLAQQRKYDAGAYMPEWLDILIADHDPFMTELPVLDDDAEQAAILAELAALENLPLELLLRAAKGWTAATRELAVDGFGVDPLVEAMRDATAILTRALAVRYRAAQAVERARQAGIEGIRAARNRMLADAAAGKYDDPRLSDSQPTPPPDPSWGATTAAEDIADATGLAERNRVAERARQTRTESPRAPGEIGVPGARQDGGIPSGTTPAEDETAGVQFREGYRKLIKPGEAESLPRRAPGQYGDAFGGSRWPSTLGDR